jgi:hypothetical protein
VTPDDFVAALAAGGTPFADDDPEYCPVHGWDHSYVGDLYHEDKCEAYAAHLTRLIP